MKRLELQENHKASDMAFRIEHNDSYIHNDIRSEIHPSYTELVNGLWTPMTNPMDGITGIYWMNPNETDRFN